MNSEMPLAGLRVMVVEDELLVAMMIEDTLECAGCVVVGPYTTVTEAREAATKAKVDAALLDVNLRGEKVYPVAYILEGRGIPFLLLSGYGVDAIPSGTVGWRACSKPFTEEGLLEALQEQIRHWPHVAD